MGHQRISELELIPDGVLLNDDDFFVFARGNQNRRVSFKALLMSQVMAPVWSVNGQVGDITLNAEDIGLEPVTTTDNGLMIAADKAKLDGVAEGATVNSTDAALRDRETHTGTQDIATVTGLQAALDGKVLAADLLEATTGKGGSLVGLSHDMPPVPGTAIDRYTRQLFVTDAPFFADVTGVDDMSVAMQAALDYGKANGFNQIVLPAGEFKWLNPVTSDYSTDTSAFSPRMSIVGVGGPRGTVVHGPNTDMTMLTLIGSNVPGAADAQIEVRDIFFSQNSKLGSILSVNRYSHMNMRNLRCNGSNLAIATTDVQESILDNVICSFANYGLRMQPGSFTSPNNMTLLHCKMGNNAYGGADFINCGQVNIFGGSYEGNHLNAEDDDPNRVMYAIRSIWNSSPNIEATVGINIVGAYIEANGMDVDSTTPTGDVWIVNSAAPSANTIMGTTFQRHDEFFLRNNIRMETSGGYAHTLNLMGNGHRGFYGYAPNIARKYVALSNPSEVYVNDTGCRYADAVEKPDFSGFNNSGHDSQVQVFARFDGASVGTGAIVPQQALNVGSVNKTGPGVYVITFARELSGGANMPHIQVIGAYGFATMTAESPGSMTIQTADGSGALADFQIAFSVLGRAVI